MPDAYFETVDSVKLYEPFWMCWRIIGINTKYNANIKALFNWSINFIVLLYFPMHLVIGLFSVRSQEDLFRNLTINVTCIVCSTKHFLLRSKLGNLKRIEDIFRKLDYHVVDAEEREYFIRVTKVGAQCVMKLFFGTYICADILILASAFFSSERKLLYPAWFPFDWCTTLWVYWLVLTYQVIGLTIVVIVNLSNDIYAPTSLCILVGHMRLLAMRVSKIGHCVGATLETTNRDLINSIEDHKQLIAAFELLQNTISMAQLIQFLASGLIICLITIYLLFFAKSIAEIAFNVIYLMAMLIELFPCCYYGSMLQQRSEELPYALFTRNWQPQSRKYHSNLRIFAEMARKRIAPLAGQIIGIHLNTFYDICKMSYSLYAVVMRMKK